MGKFMTKLNTLVHRLSGFKHILSLPVSIVGMNYSGDIRGVQYDDML